MKPRDAFDRSNRDCILIPAGFGQYAVQHAWRDIDGPRTVTYPRDYWKAREQRIGLVVFTALELMGYERESCQWARDLSNNGRARDRFRAALFKLGPVSMTEMER